MFMDLQSRIRIRNCQQAKKLIKTLTSAVQWLNEFLSLKTDINVPTESNEQKNLDKNLSVIGILEEKTPFFCWHHGSRWREESRIWTQIRKSSEKIQGSGSGSLPKCHVSGTLIRYFRQDFFRVLDSRWWCREQTWPNFIPL